MCEIMITIRMLIATWMVEKALRIMPHAAKGKLDLAMAHHTVCKHEVARLERMHANP